MEYILMVKLNSRYGETDPLDIQEMQNKIRHWMSLIQKENNNSNHHLGLHLSILEYQVFPDNVPETFTGYIQADIDGID